jgi:hypothetical protein
MSDEQPKNKNAETYPFAALVASDPSFLVIFEVLLVLKVNLATVEAEEGTVVGVEALESVPSLVIIPE